jgi:secreted trypsin-like serine protease
LGYPEREKKKWTANRMIRSSALARSYGRRLAPIVFAIMAGVTLGGRTTDKAAAMVGGAPPAASGIGRSVVLILGSYGASSTACTATAIGRDLLLTAAHCVQPGADYKLVASETGDAPVLKDVAHIEREPQFDLKRLLGHLATADVALIKLAEPLPARIPPVRIGSEAEAVTVGDTLVVVGYGDTVRGDGRTGGTVRAAPLVVTGQPGTLQIRLVDPATKGASAGLGACTGDSGAPAFREAGGSLTVIGVVSWSTGPNLSAGCGGLTGITPLVRYRAWIVDTARRFGSPLAP